MAVVLHLAHIYQSLTMCQGTFPVTQWLRDQPSSAQEMVSLVEKVRSHTPRVTKHPSY